MVHAWEGRGKRRPCSDARRNIIHMLDPEARGDFPALEARRHFRTSYSYHRVLYLEIPRWRQFLYLDSRLTNGQIPESIYLVGKIQVVESFVRVGFDKFNHSLQTSAAASSMGSRC